MKESARYVKIVEWSEEDQCFVGSFLGCFTGAVMEAMSAWCSRGFATSWKKRSHSTNPRDDHFRRLHPAEITPIR